MAIKMPPKTEQSIEIKESESWVKEGKNADNKVLDK